MSERITMSQLVLRLSVRTADSKRESEDFIKELFSIITAALERGESVKIPGLGMFKSIDVEARKSVDVTTGEDNLIPAHRKVVFMASKELAATVNEPFSMFQTIELDDEEPEHEETEEQTGQAAAMAVDAEIPETKEPEASEINESDMPEVKEPEVPEVKEAEAPEEKELDTPEEKEPEDEEGNSPEPNVVYVEPEVDSQPIYETIDDAEETSTASDEEQADFDITHVPVSAPEAHKQDSVSKSRFWAGFGSGFAVACLVGVLVWGITVVDWSSFNSNKRTMANGQKEVANQVDTIAAKTQSDTIATTVLPVGEVEEPEEVEPVKSDVDIKDAVPTQPSDKKEYDTITKTRYLTTMAKDHYGNYHLWPYIYKENEAILGHPDRIRPGTKVVIPDLKKYGINPKKPEDIAKAKKLGNQIYSRYR